MDPNKKTMKMDLIPVFISILGCITVTNCYTSKTAEACNVKPTIRIDINTTQRCNTINLRNLDLKFFYITHQITNKSKDKIDEYLILILHPLNFKRIIYDCNESTRWCTISSKAGSRKLAMWTLVMVIWSIYTLDKLLKNT